MTTQTLTTDNWKLAGLCRETDPDAFYPDAGGSARAAKQICGRCPVTHDCLTNALLTGERFGVWGGTTESERRQLRRGQPK